MQTNKKHTLISRKGAYALFCVIISCNFFAQSITNLVNNYSAEQYTSCPVSQGQVYNSNFWFLPTGNGSSDYYNTCSTFTGVSVPTNQAGFQNARTGNAYFGFVTYGIIISGVQYREYLGNPLKFALQIGKTYCVNYYVSLAENSRYASANIGIILSKDSIIDHTGTYPPPPLVYTPNIENTSIISDTSNWVKIEGKYISNGTERFITIGNFRPDINTINSPIKPLSSTALNYAYYYIDDISVLEINNANAALRDTLTKCAAASFTLGTDSTEFASYTWQSTPTGLAALSCSNCPNPIASPSITTKYYLTKMQCSSTTRDSVLIIIHTPTTTANAGPDSTICLGDKIIIGTKDSLAFTSYAWQPGAGLSCTNCATPLANPSTNTTYTLQRTECAFITSNNISITIDDCEPTYTIPTIFTPNYDGKNDTWGVMFSNSKYIKDFSVNVYDRWGLMVFASEPGTSTPNIKWDGHTLSGTPCADGVYFYMIEFIKNEEPVKLKGFISLYK